MKLMSIDDEQSIRDTVTASSPAESGANEFDDWLGVPFDLIRFYQGSYKRQGPDTETLRVIF
jgi:hypothetical protein